VPRKSRLVDGVKGHNMNEIAMSGSPALWAGSFTFGIRSSNWRNMMDRKKIEEVIKGKAKDGKLPCAVCFKMAEDFGISKREMGKILNEVKVKISQCQLGCFE